MNRAPGLVTATISTVMNSPSPRGRRRGKPDTRARILDVARRRSRHPGDLATFPERALRTVLGLWDDPETGAPLRALIAGAAHDAAFAAVVKETMQQAVIDKIADRVGGKDARKRAAAFYAQIAGLIGTRYLLRLDPIASMSPDDIVEIYRAPLRLALDSAPQTS